MDSMHHALDRLIGEVNEWMAINTPSRAPVFRDRHVKRKLRLLLQSPLIFLNSDTFVQGDSRERFKLQSDIAAAPDHSRDHIMASSLIGCYRGLEQIILEDRLNLDRSVSCPIASSDGPAARRT
jgi:hypothetical protein